MTPRLSSDTAACINSGNSNGVFAASFCRSEKIFPPRSMLPAAMSSDWRIVSACAFAVIIPAPRSFNPDTTPVNACAARKPPAVAATFFRMPCASDAPRFRSEVSAANTTFSSAAVTAIAPYLPNPATPCSRCLASAASASAPSAISAQSRHAAGRSASSHGATPRYFAARISPYHSGGPSPSSRS